MASSRHVRIHDHAIATFLLGIGFAALMMAQLRNANPWGMSPGMDGVMCMGILGFAVMMLHRIEYRATLTHLLPVFGIQLGCALLNGTSGFTLVGVQAVLFGVVGLLVAKPAPRRPPSRRRHVHRHHSDHAPATA